jgi:hypothetical protein
MPTKLVTIKEYILSHAKDKKSKVYQDVKDGVIPTVERYGVKFIRVKV